MESRDDHLGQLVLRNRGYSNEMVDFAVLTIVTFGQLHHECQENKFRKFIVLRNEEDEERGNIVMGLGKIGMPGIQHGERTVRLVDDLEEFAEYILSQVTFLNARQVNVEYINAQHLVYDQPASDLPETLTELLMRLIDEYMPTGILHLDELLNVESILDQIKHRLWANELVEPELSKQFYQIIPQNGKEYRLEHINNPEMYRNKIEVLDRLRSALESIYAGLRSPMNPIDYFIKYWLRTEFHELDRNSGEFQELNHCIESTQHPNGRLFTLATAFRVASSADTEFAHELHNQRFLFHFTYPCNILGILREGLQVAPRHIHSQNRFLGDGIYFWDCASMALHAFNKLPEEMPPVLLVCRVALGNVRHVNGLQPADELQNDSNSFFQTGREFATVADDQREFANSTMYCGNVAQSSNFNFDNYNKYMVKNKRQVKIEYILTFQRNN